MHDFFACESEPRLPPRPDPPFAVRAASTYARPDWAPTVQDVADVSQAFTRGPVDGEIVQSGTELGMFDETTSPTDSEVEAYIDVAVKEVSARVGMGLDWLNQLPDLARMTATWHAARSIEAEKAPQNSEETTGAYSWKQSSYVACLNELMGQARRTAMRLA